MATLIPSRIHTDACACAPIAGLIAPAATSGNFVLIVLKAAEARHRSHDWTWHISIGAGALRRWASISHWILPACLGSLLTSLRAWTILAALAQSRARCLPTPTPETIFQGIGRTAGR
jgi:hypothetical protein